MMVRRVVVATTLVCTLAVLDGLVPQTDGVLPAGFSDDVVLSGLETPTAVAFALDGRIFIAEKSGIVKVFDSLSDTSAAVFADLRTQVHDYSDRGLLGLALDPAFPSKPYVYVLYTRDALIGGVAPRWGTAGTSGDPCPLADNIGCTASGRLSRLKASGNTWDGTEQVLIDDWFQQFNSHSLGSLAFGPDGALYASGGDGASWQFVDYGQAGSPPNPAGDPPVPVGGTQTPPTAEGGALRAQDLETSSDPTGLDGTVIRVNPDTGAALPDNPRSSASDPNTRRVVGYGLRNPFRITIRPGTRELWVGDVGWQDYEEINLIPDPASGTVPNFGWPCYDGTGRQPGYDAANLNICESLYSRAGAVTFSVFQYREDLPVVSGDGCRTADQSLSGLAFYEGSSYPSQYQKALFFADYTRGCIWYMPAGADGRPDPARRSVFAVNASFPVDLKTGPGGDLFYVDLTGSLHRIRYGSGDQAPRASIVASPQSGPAPLAVAFDGRGSSDPEGGPLRFEWDLDGDGAFDDSTAATATFTYATNGTYVARLRVTDPGNLQGSASTTIIVGNSSPTAVIDTPAATLLWRVGQTYSFSGHATDPEQGVLPPASLSWSILLNHCSTPTSCHQHPLRDYPGTATGSFTAPDHEYPSFLTLRLTARDSGGLTHQVERRLDPQAVTVTFATQPSGLQVALSGETFTTPATRTLIVGSNVTIAAVTPQTLAGVIYSFWQWSDGGAATHTIAAPALPVTYTASFSAASSAFPPGWTWRDIGTHGAAATATNASGVFTMTNAGTDIWSTADGFTYSYRPLTGDGEIVARVRTMAGGEPWTKAGVMIRESIDAGSPHAFMLTSVGRGMAFQWRRSAGALSEHLSAGAVGGAPQWVRVRRAGSVITAATSTDGVTWNTVGSTTLSMPASVLVGLALTSHTTAATASAAFDHVRVNSTLPAGWSSRDIGPVGIDGSTTLAGSVMTLHAAGADIWGTSDAFRYAHRSLTGDGQIIARVASVTGSQAWTKAGVMIRSTLSSASSHAFLLVSTGRGVAFQRRPSAGGSSVHTAVDTSVAPRWLRLTRSGPLVTAWVSHDGASWVAVASDTIELGATVEVGVALTSHDVANIAAATFDSVQVAP